MLGAAVLAGSVLLAAGVLWFVADPAKYLLVEAQRAGRPLRDAALAALAGLEPVQWGLMAAAAASALAMLWVEWRGRAISASLRSAGGLSCAISFTAVLLWFGHAYLYPGHLLSGDTGAHVTRIAHLARGLDEGKLLYWDNYFYGGATLMQFTGPLFFWLGAAAAWLAGDAVLGTKIVLLALHLASGWSLYWLLRSYGSERAASVIGAVVYAGAFAHLHLILYKGALPQSVVLALLPLIFLAADRMARAERLLSAGWAATAVLVAALVATHQPHGFVAGLYLGAYIVASLALGRYRLAVLPRAVSAAVLAALMASFAVVPWIAEADQVMVSGQPRMLYWEWPDAEYFSKLLTWANTWTTPGTPSVAYVGLSSAVLALVAIALARPLRSAPEPRRIAAIYVALLLVSFGLRAEYLRDVIFTLFAVAVLGGLGAAALMASRPGWRRLPLALLAIIVLDLGATAVQPLARRDKAYLDAAGAELAAMSPPSRVVLANSYADGEGGGLRIEFGPASGPVSYYPVQTLFGPHNLAATPLHNYALGLLSRVQSDLRVAHALSPDTRALLAMLNVGRIVNDDGAAMGLPPGIAGASNEATLGSTIRIEEATPVVFAPRLVQIDPDPGLDKPVLWAESVTPDPSPQARGVDRLLSNVIDAMAFAPAAARAQAIPVRRLPAGLAPPPAMASDAAATSPAAVVSAYQVSTDLVTLRVRLSAPGFVQLAHAWYPLQAVTVDGTPATALQGTLNLIVLPMDAGEHAVEIEPRRTTLRAGFDVASAVLFALGMAIVVLSSLRASR